MPRKADGKPIRCLLLHLVACQVMVGVEWSDVVGSSGSDANWPLHDQHSLAVRKATASPLGQMHIPALIVRLQNGRIS
jgi:hypothetical protein